MPTSGSSEVSSILLVILALVPAVILFAFIYMKDKVEKEPISMLIGLFFLGALSIVPAAFAEYFALDALGGRSDSESVGMKFIQNFFVIALAEECCKFLMLRIRTWKSRHFNYTFDAVVYAVVVSLGFAALENVMYVLEYKTLEIAFWRGVLSVPGHAIDAVFMGVFYGKAKYCECCGNKSGKRTNIALSLLVPIATHGTYDFCLSIQSNFEGAMALFFGFVITTTVVAIIYVQKSSKGDSAIPGMGTPFWQFPNYPYNYYSQMQYQQGYYTPNGYMQYNNYNYQNPQNYQGYGNYQGYQNYQNPQGYQNYNSYQNDQRYQSYQNAGDYQQDQYRNYGNDQYGAQNSYYDPNGDPQRTNAQNNSYSGMR